MFTNHVQLVALHENQWSAWQNIFEPTKKANTGSIGTHWTRCLIDMLVRFAPLHAHEYGGRRTEELVAPLADLQVFIRLPEKYYVPTDRNEVLLHSTIDTLVSIGIPLQLFFHKKRTESVQSSRHLGNQNAWLVLAGDLAQANSMDSATILDRSGDCANSPPQNCRASCCCCPEES